VIPTDLQQRYVRSPLSTLSLLVSTEMRVCNIALTMARHCNN
jgi:hypothetical protein